MADQWYYTQRQRRGPVPEELRQLAASGQLKPDDLVWKKGMASWAPVSLVQGLFANAEDEPPPLPSELPPPPSPQESLKPNDSPQTLGATSGPELIPPFPTTDAGPTPPPMSVPLSAMQLRILEFLADKQDWATRDEIGARTGDKKGFSKALGAPTNPPIKPDSLEGRGFVERRGTTHPFQYRITPSGQLALSRATGMTPPKPIPDTPGNSPPQAPPQVVPLPAPPGPTARKFAKDFAHLRLAGYRNINERTRPEHQLHGCETLFGDFSARVMVLLQDFANVPIVQERVQRGEPNPFHHSLTAQTNVNLIRLFAPYFTANINGDTARTCGLYYANAVWLLKEDPKGDGKSASLPRLRQVLGICEPVFRATLQNLPNLELIIAFGSVAFRAIRMYFNIDADWLGTVVNRKVLPVGKYLVAATTHSTARGVMRRQQMTPDEPDPMAEDIRASMQAIGKSPR